MYKHDDYLYLMPSCFYDTPSFSIFYRSMQVETCVIYTVVCSIRRTSRVCIELHNCLHPLLGPRPRFSHARSSSPIIFPATAPTAAAACKILNHTVQSAQTQHLMMSTVNCICAVATPVRFPAGQQPAETKQLITIPHSRQKKKNHQIFSAR